MQQGSANKHVMSLPSVARALQTIVFPVPGAPAKLYHAYSNAKFLPCFQLIKNSTVLRRISFFTSGSRITVSNSFHLFLKKQSLVT